MALQTRRVRYGPEALAALEETVAAAQGQDRLAPVTIVVPDSSSVVGVRRELARRRPIAGVCCLTLRRLAGRIGAPALRESGRRPISTGVVVQAVRQALSVDPGLFAAVAEHPATEECLVRAWRELGGLSPDALGRLASAGPLTAAVVGVVRRVRVQLRPAWYDEHDLIEAAIVAAKSSQATINLGPVVVYLPQRLPARGGELLRVLSRTWPVSLLVGASGSDRADSPVLESLEAAGVDVPRVAASQPQAMRIISVTDPDEEARVAAGVVVEALANGARFGDVAVILGQVNPYSRLIHQHLAAAGIPVAGPGANTLRDSRAAQVLTGLLALPTSRFRRDQVMGWLADSPIMANPSDPAPVGTWDRISRAAGVYDGPDWSHRLASFALDCRQRALDPEVPDRPGRSARLLADAEAADDLSAVVRSLRDQVHAGDGLGTWADLADWVAGLLQTHLGTGRAGWPPEQARAAERLAMIVARLGDLDCVGGPTPTSETFLRTLDSELDGPLAHSTRVGQGVLVGPASMVVGMRLAQVVMIGLAEGTFPARRSEDSLLPDRDRALTNGQLELTTSGLHQDHLHFLAAVACGPTVLIFPRGDLRRPGPRLASRWLLDQAQLLAGSDERLYTSDLRPGLGPWFEFVESFNSGVGNQPLPASEQEYRLGSLLRHGGETSSSPLAGRDPVLAAGAAMAQARRSTEFTRFDGNLSEAFSQHPLPSGVFSATSMEAWAKCPFHYLITHVLRVEVPEEPERRLQLNHLDRGLIIHQCLEKFMTESSQDRIRLGAIAAEVCDEFAARGRGGRGVLWVRDRARILADLDAFYVQDLAWRLAYSATTVAIETAFEATLALPEGSAVGTVRIKGRIDRIDRCADGGVVVIDYKSGGSKKFADLGPTDSHLEGTCLQPWLYASVARQSLSADRVEFRFRFVGKGAGSDDPARAKPFGFEVTEEVDAKAGAAVALVASGISQGLFPARPPAVPSFLGVDCWSCTPDGLNSSESRRAWERKRHHALLGPYRFLCESDENFCESAEGSAEAAAGSREAGARV
ncbi:MAG: PD-(D/E)XK nuclease family protein [Acidimicrobiales bacterium]